VAWAHSLGVPPTSSVVFQASNMMWARRGMEAHVLTHQQSVPRVSTALQCRRFDRDRSRNAMQRCTSVGRLMADRHDEPCEGQSSPDREHACGLPDLPGLDFVVAGKHEGSYYRVADVLRAAALIANATRRAVGSRGGRDDAQRSSLGRWQQKCCTPDETFGAVGFNARGFLEESVLQTMTANGLLGEPPSQQPNGGDILSRLYMEVGTVDLAAADAFSTVEEMGDEHAHFQVPFAVTATSNEEDGEVVDTEEVEIEANCTWLRQQVAGAFSIKSHELRTSAALRGALNTCRFPEHSSG